MHYKKSPSSLNRRSPLGLSLGAGVGAAILGALLLTFGFGRKKNRRHLLSEAISPTIFATHVLNTSFGEIVYHTSGSGEPLLFLHGVFPGASSFEWSKVYPYFASRHLVLVPDLIGFGESQRPNPAISVEAQAHALAQFLENTTNGQPATIIASGLSAYCALLLSSLYPNKVAELQLWRPLLNFHETSSLVHISRLVSFFRLGRMIYERQLSSESFIKQWLLNSGFSPNDASLQEAVTVLTSTAQQYGAEHAFLAQSSRKFWRHALPRLTTISQPITLLVNKEAHRATNDTIATLRSFASHLAINEIETPSPLAPLTDASVMIAAIAQRNNLSSRKQQTGDRTFGK